MVSTEPVKQAMTMACMSVANQAMTSAPTERP